MDEPKEEGISAELAWNSRQIICDLERVKILIGAEADLNYVDEHGYTALMNAAAMGNRALCELLCDAGADITYESPRTGDQTALFVAAWFKPLSQSTSICELLVEKMLTPDAKEMKKRYTLMNCLNRNYNRGDYVNLSHVLRKYFLERAIRNRSKAFRFVMDDLLDSQQIKVNLLQKYFLDMLIGDN